MTNKLSKEEKLYLQHMYKDSYFIEKALNYIEELEFKLKTIEYENKNTTNNITS